MIDTVHLLLLLQKVGLVSQVNQSLTSVLFRFENILTPTALYIILLSVQPRFFFRKQPAKEWCREFVGTCVDFLQRKGFLLSSCHQYRRAKQEGDIDSEESMLEKAGILISRTCSGQKMPDS